MLQPASPNWDPPVLTCSALEMTGVAEIWQTVLTFHKQFTRSGELAHKRQKQALDWLWSMVEDELKQRFYNNPEIKQRLDQITRAVARGETAPTLAADKLLFFLDNQRLV
jgi:LAO/AO transport system kinase